MILPLRCPEYDLMDTAGQVQIPRRPAWSWASVDVVVRGVKANRGREESLERLKGSRRLIMLGVAQNEVHFTMLK